MFPAETYIRRREELAQKVGSGIILFLGNDLSPINYDANTYPFRQDSSFLYYSGIREPANFLVMDLDEGETTLYGYEQSMDDIVWEGERAPLKVQAEMAGIPSVQDIEFGAGFLLSESMNDRTIHVLPAYQEKHLHFLSAFFSCDIKDLGAVYSHRLIEAVVAQRSKKEQQEIEEIKKAIDISDKMHREAIAFSKDGRKEQEIVAQMQRICGENGVGMAYGSIFTQRGEILHNNLHNGVLADGSLVLNDSGAESPFHYASDITRTFPVNGSFSDKQKDIYSIVLEAQNAVIDSIRPGIAYIDLHLKASEIIASGLAEIGIIKGDPKEAVKEGAHALFFPHGLGHMLGLDVHDMEGLGEDFVGYADGQERSEQFGLNHLRLARELEEGFVLTVEPGIYFIPKLIDGWKSTGAWNDFINFELLEEYRDFGGIRLEDNVLVTADGAENLSEAIPKLPEEIEALIGTA